MQRGSCDSSTCGSGERHKEISLEVSAKSDVLLMKRGHYPHPVPGLERYCDDEEGAGNEIVMMRRAPGGRERQIDNEACAGSEIVLKKNAPFHGH